MLKRLAKFPIQIKKKKKTLYGGQGGISEIKFNIKNIFRKSDYEYESEERFEDIKGEIRRTKIQWPKEKGQAIIYN